MNNQFFPIPSARQFLMGACFCAALAPSALFADSEHEINELKNKIEEERVRLDAMEKQLSQLSPQDMEESDAATDQGLSGIRQLIAADGRNDPYLDKDFTKSIPLVGSPWRFSFGGYAKTDLIHDFSGHGDEQEFILSQIPVEGSPQEGSYSHIQISETRFHFETRNSDSAHENSLYIEFDFFDKSNTFSPRLRHAYVRYGKLLVGQTWTLLSELRQLPLMLDFAAGDSILGGRTQQLRWTEHSKDKTLGWAIALESFNDSAIYNPTSLDGIARSNFPRLTTGVTKLWDRLTWSSGVSVTQLRFDGTQEVSDTSELAVTATTAGRVYLTPSKTHWFGFGFGYQSGSITDVITFANGGIPNAAIDDNGELELAKAWNTQLGLNTIWTSKLSSNFSYAYTKMTHTPDAFEPEWIRIGSAFHANLIYKYDDQLSLGIEAMHGDRENINGDSGDAQRLQFSSFYYF